MEKAAIFVDVQNIYYTVKQQYNCHFNYNAFMDECGTGRSIVKAIAYATDKGDKKQMNFQQILKRIGFEVRLIPFIQRSDGSTKGDWDVGIAIDMLEFAKLADTVILASGDGDYVSAIDKIKKEYNVAVEVYGVPGLTASNLIDSATRFIPIQGNLLMPIPVTWGDNQ